MGPVRGSSSAGAAWNLPACVTRISGAAGGVPSLWTEAWDPWGLGSDPNSTAQAQGPLALHTGGRAAVNGGGAPGPPRPAAGWNTTVMHSSGGTPLRGSLHPHAPVCAPSDRWAWGSRPPGQRREGRGQDLGAQTCGSRGKLCGGGSWTRPEPRGERPDRARVWPEGAVTKPWLPEGLRGSDRLAEGREM